MSDLRAANISTEKFARVAVQHGLHKYIRHNNANVLSRKVKEFVIAVKEEGMVVHGGKIKAPKVLADIVESVAAAVFVDCGLNVHKMWTIFKRLLEPLVMLNVVLAQPQPVNALFEACHKDGKRLDIRYTKNGNRLIANVYVDDTFISSASSLNKETTKLHAAEAALAKLIKSDSCDTTPQFNLDGFDESKGIECAKHKVVQLCDKKRCQKPTFRLEQELGPSHDRIFVYSVEIELPETIMKVKGNEKSRKKDAENYAATNMLLSLKCMGLSFKRG